MRRRDSGATPTLNQGLLAALSKAVIVRHVPLHLSFHAAGKEGMDLLLRRSARTIDTYAVAEMRVGEDGRAVGDGHRCAPAATGRGVEGLQGRNRWGLVSVHAHVRAEPDSSLPMVSTRPVNMAIIRGRTGKGEGRESEGNLGLGLGEIPSRRFAPIAALSTWGIRYLI